MKPVLIRSFLLSCLLLVFLEACSDNRPTTNGGSPPGAPGSSAPISSSADVVKIRAASTSFSAGGQTEANVLLSISSGFHVNANPATFPYLIATQVTPGKAEGISAGTPVYPGAVKKKFQFAEQPLAVYEGEIVIKLPLRAENNAATGPRSLPIAVRVQACDEEQCFPPAIVNAAISIDVK